MNSSDIFTMGAAGAQSEASIGLYQNFVNSSFSNVPDSVSGWLLEKTEKLKSGFKSFIDSRMWELSARIGGGNEGEFVGRFNVGYLKSIGSFQNAEGVMRDYIMANANVSQLYADDIIEGYGGEFSLRNTGVGKDNIFWRQANNGVFRKEDENWLHSHYLETSGNKLSFRERVDVHRTWRAIDHHIATTYLDITSPTSRKRKDHVETDEDGFQPIDVSID